MNAKESNRTESNQADFPEDHQEADEFSLDELRKVYAKVIQEKRAADQLAAPAFPASPTESSDDNPINSRQSLTLTDSDQASQPETKASIKSTADNPENKPGTIEMSASSTESDDDAQVPVTPQTIVEAILFVGDSSGKKLTLKRIASVLRDVSPQEVKQIIQLLNQQYQEEHAAYRIFFDKDRVEMRLDEAMHDFQISFMGSNRTAKLAAAAIEVLAIVAYNQPIGGSKIDELRKKPSNSLLKQLQKHGLIDMIESNGKERVWKTTDKFLDMFNLSDPDELPKSQHFDDLDELLA